MHNHCVANMAAALTELGVDLSKIPDQVGAAVMELDGSVLEATGELEGNESGLITLYQMLQDAGTILQHTKQGVGIGKTEGFRRLTVTFTDHSYVVTIASGRIIIVKKGGAAPA